MAGVGQPNQVRIAVSNVAQKETESLGEVGPGSQRPELFERHGRHVDRIESDATDEILHQLLNNAYADELLRFLSRSGDVRSCHHGRVTEERLVDRRFLIKNV